MLFWRTFQMVMMLSVLNISEHEDCWNFTFLEPISLDDVWLILQPYYLRERAVTSMAPLGNHLAFPRPTMFYRGRQPKLALRTEAWLLHTSKN